MYLLEIYDDDDDYFRDMAQTHWSLVNYFEQYRGILTQLDPGFQLNQ